MGGEKRIFCIILTASDGSPPRGRGKAYFLLFRVRIRGITPAWAGKRARADGVYGSYEDHPRVGGEKLLHLFIQPNRPGSPPRGRGKGNKLSISQCTKWITPAWAGKSRPCGSDRTGKRDHPRVGGEKYGSGHRPPTPQGSPPRGRGKGLRRRPHNEQPWITPAWAGKRLKRSHRSGIFISGPIPFHSVLHRPAGSGGSRAGRDGSPAGQPQNTGPA